jgi:ribonuclease J
MKNPVFHVIPLGGVGEFGANATVVQTARTSILIDFGLMFPHDPRQPGVEYYVIDPDRLLQDFPDLSAVFVTHAHEDHIGGLPFLAERRDLPIYTMPYTAGIIRQRMERQDVKADLREVALNQPIQHHDLTVEFIGVTHSIVQACALLVRSQGLSMIHSGDFKVDALPGDDYPFQSARLRQVGDEGVDLLIVDSTNGNKAGFCPSDYDIVETLEEQIALAPGRVFFTTFSSHIPRLRKLVGIAERSGRKVVLVGSSFLRHYANSLDTRYLSHTAGTIISSKDAGKYQDRELIFVVTGSQGERRAVLARLARESVQGLRLKAADTVILSSKAIPGNERIIAMLVSDLESRGVRVVSNKEFNIHTSGHGYREDSAYMLALTRARTVIPIHGEFSHLLSHFRWLKDMAGPKQEVMLMQNGDIMKLSGSGVKLSGQMEIPMVPIDGTSDLPMPGITLKQRKDMMYSGLLLVSAWQSGRKGGLQVEIRTPGMVEREPGELEHELRRHLGPLLRAGDCSAEKLATRCRQWLRSGTYGRPLLQILWNGCFVGSEDVAPLSGSEA